MLREHTIVYSRTVEQGLEVPSLKYRGFASTQQEKTGSVQDDALNKGIAARCC
jgi:hypothetical protein